jgi:hypothetical protein
MSEFLELALEFVINLVGGILEAMAEIWFGDLTGSDTKGNRIFWCVVIVLLGIVIWWKFVEPRKSPVHQIW